MRALATTLLLISAATAAAQADHLQCFKIKDTVPKVKYTANLTPTDTNFPVANGCIVKVPAKLLCIDVQKAVVVGTPPGAGPGAPAQKYLCYKTKCPKAPQPATVQDQFGTHAVTVKTTSLLCAPEPLPTTTTTTTSSTTTTTPPCVPSGPEVCNGIDDDCNGMVDDGLGQSTCGVGACQNTVQNCIGGVPQMCQPGMPAPNEICGNMIDDDCNGLVDEGGCVCFSAGQCPNRPNAIAQCTMSQCTFFCQMGYADCNNQPVDGCEVYTQSDPNNCGLCGTVCPLRPNTTAPNCNAGTCTLGPCSPGYANCNGGFVDGCEINITSDPGNCGACGAVCPGFAPNCVNSACTP
jgi:putative metal-binding protein